MGIKPRILFLLSLLGLSSLGFLLLFNHEQQRERREYEEQNKQKQLISLQHRLNEAMKPVYKYVRTQLSRESLRDFLTSRDRAWAEKHIRGKMTRYQIDAVWILDSAGAVIYGYDRKRDLVADISPLINPKELDRLFGDNEQIGFYTWHGGELYRLYGQLIRHSSPVETQQDWLVAGIRLDQEMLAFLTGADGEQAIIASFAEANQARDQDADWFWLPLKGQYGKIIAKLGFKSARNQYDQRGHEYSEVVLFALSNVCSLLLVGALLSFWLIRPLNQLRQSLRLNKPDLLVCMLGRRDEFGDVSRIAYSSMNDRLLLAKSLADREQLGRDLHDGAIQNICAIGMTLGSANTMLDRDLQTTRILIDQARSNLADTIAELRAHVNRTEPSPLTANFTDAMMRLCQILIGSIPLKLEIDIDEQLAGRYPALHRRQLLQLIREAVSNALRHGRPARIIVSWQVSADGSRMIISDDGVGMKKEADPPLGCGMTNLHERADLLGGRLSVESSRQSGTTLRIDLPPPVSQ